MKLAYHLVLSLGFTFGLAFAEVANEPDYSNVKWAQGVSVNGETGKVEGWYDAEKTREKGYRRYAVLCRLGFESPCLVAE